MTNSISEQSIRDSLQASAINAVSSVSAPVTPIQQSLCAIWCDTLNVERVGIDDEFFDLGGSSLHAMVILSAIENKFGVRLPLSILIEAPTVSLLEKAIQAENGQDLSPLLIRFQAGCDGLAPLFLVHGLLGHIFLTPELLSGIDPRRPVYGIHARGMASREPPVDSVHTAAQEYIDAIKSVSAGGPFHLGGFCSGNIIVLEMAVALERVMDKAPTPILIDPPVVPGGHNWRDRRFGRVRLAMRKLKRLETRSDTIERRSFQMRDDVLRRNPNVADPAIRSRIVNTASNMRDLLSYHLLSAWPSSAIMLTSRERGRWILEDQSFWRRFSADRLSVHVVAETHGTVFGKDRPKVFNRVNRIVEELDSNPECTVGA